MRRSVHLPQHTPRRPARHSPAVLLELLPMRHFRTLTPSSHLLLRGCLILLLSLAIPARATMEEITKSIWKMSYGVTAAQIANQTWLDSGDDDKDGITNGAEIAAGTDPFDASKSVRITSIVPNGPNVELTFPAIRGKRYQVQSTTNLGGGTWAPAGAPVIGSADPVQTLSVPFAAETFYRIVVTDVDSDGDGASDWAERVAGFDPNDSTTNGGTTPDGTVLASAITTSDIVTVSVTKGDAIQPLSGYAPIETGSITVSRGGPLKFHSIVVPLQKTGSAAEGIDYDTLPASVTFPIGVSEVVLAIYPRANSARKTNVTAIVKALGGIGYSLGSVTSGSVVINPAGIANGTGLSASYHHTSSNNYPTQQTIFAGATEIPLPRTDATINFSNGAGGWGSTAGPTDLSPDSSNGAFSVRWTGQILPQFSETYTIDFRSDDSAKVWVNGQLLIDRWTTQSATDYTNTIDLQAGILYDIQIDYWNSGGGAEAKLYWWSPSQVRQIIPQGRLFPAPALAAKPTAITSALAAIGYEGTPFAFNVTSANTGGTTTYSLAVDGGELPPGLTLNTATGAITGTPTLAGNYHITVDAINAAAAAVTGSSIVKITIFPVGGVTRELLAANGSAVSDLVVPPATTVPSHDTIATIDSDSDYGSSTGQRLRGYLIPPKTGNYYFWIAANNAAELWISNDSEYVNRVRRASVAGDSGKKVWNAQSTQQTQWLALVAGEKYYFEVLHNTSADADDHVAVGWCQDDIGTVPAVVGAANPTGALTLIPNGGSPLQGYPFSGTVPGFIFQPYDYPVLTPPQGTLYACNLGPQGGAQTSASGSANIQVNATETEAILHFKYQNLGSPKTAYHLHVDGFTGDDDVIHPQGEIIYDIDDADALPALRTADGGYIWDLTAPVGSFSNVDQIREAIRKGKVYLNVHSVNYPAGEIRGTFGLIDGSQTPPNPALYAEPAGTEVPSNAAHAARFLNQATFGASPADVAFVQGSGFQGWITDQLAKTPSRTSNDVVAGLTADINTPYPSTLFTNTWWKNSITGPDQLRQRLAFALSEIMVVSWADNTGPLQNNGRVLADYYDQLVDHCLPTPGVQDSGNFRGILRAVTLTPAMGLYLDMRGNQKGDPTIGRHPNENYARELMQLFSIGIYRMWDDGRFVLGSDAGLVSTYSQPSIIGLANLLTGWNYAQPNQANGRAPTSFGPGADYLNAMVLVPAQHELGSKLLLNNVVSPAATGRTPRVGVMSITTGTPCTINTGSNSTTPLIHGLKVGDTVRIANITGGTFDSPINASHLVTEIVDADSFRVAINCTGAPTGYTNATVTGATVTPAAISGTAGIAAVTGSQADNAGSTTPHPYDLYGLKELDLAIDNIVNNDNVGPYICRQLIQRFVTSDPSPGYVYRVVQKFRNNGSGVRGDMAAVITQILLDGEARGNPASPGHFGKQREPMLRLTGPARAFPAANYTGTYTQLTGANAHKLRIVTSSPNDFNSGFTVSLNFRDNYTATNPPNPYTNPTSTAYSVNATLGIANTTTDIASIEQTSPCRVHTVTPHGLSNGNGVIITGITGGVFSQAVTSQRTVNVIDSDTFEYTSVNCTAAPTSVTSARMISNPAKITTVQPHGLSTGDSVTISSSGGTFNPAINGATFTVTVVDATSFTVPSNCTVAATANTGSLVGANTLDVLATGMANASYTQTAGSNIVTVSTGGPPTNIVVPGTAVTITSIGVGNPCEVTTSGAHNLVSDGLVTISNVADGAFATAINGTFTPTVTGANTFTIPVDCTVAAATGTSTKRIRSKVYLDFLTQTAVGGAAPIADGVYEVQSNPTTGSFTVITADTPATARGGNVIVPKLTTSYTPQSSNTIVQFNTNVNHNMQMGENLWVDVPVVGSPLSDAEYTINAVTDEDHFKIPYEPTNKNGGTYPKPSGSNNGITIYPLVPPPMGRSGVVTINQSTFNLGSTDGSLTQSPLNAPTVFNFFFPDYKFPGSLANSGLDSPEFQLTTDTNVMNLTNSMTNMIIGTGGANGNLNGLTSFNNGNGTVVMNIEPFMTNAKTSEAGIPALVDELSNLLVGGPLATTPRSRIIAFVNHKNGSNVLDYFPYTTPTNLQKRDRVRAIIHLIITSAEYAVQK